MSKTKNIKRRSFLRNTVLGSLALGLSSKSAAENNFSKETLFCDATTLDLFGQGPFYTDNPPFLDDNKLAKDDEAGSRMIISGRIFNLDCSEFIPNTIVDVWHANDAGEYDNDNYNLRGYTMSN